MRPWTTSGSHGSAWHVELPESVRARGSVAWWVAEVPGAHPMWRWYFVSAIHLRPIAGDPDAHLEWPTATHELQVWASDTIDVDAPAAEMVRGKLLAPQNLVVQLELASDEHAAQLTEDLVEAFVRGAVSPDTDWRRAQLELLRDRVRFRQAGPDRELVDSRDRRPA